MLGDRGGALVGKLAAGAALVVMVGACSSAGASATAGGAGQTPASATPATTPTGSISSLAVEATFEQALPYFGYDTTLPLDIKDATAPKTEDGVTVRDITYAATADLRVPAFLVTPAGSGPFAAMIYLHAEGAGGITKSQYLSEAVALAKKGVVSLLPSRYFPGNKSSESWQVDRQSVVDAVVQLRRGIDLLTAHAGVDAKRIGFLGHDWGGIGGTVLVAVDPRVKTALFVSLNSTWAEWMFLNQGFFPEEIRPEYLKAMTCLDPVTALTHATSTTVFVQWGENDGFVSAEARSAIKAAAAGAKTVNYPNIGWQVDSTAAIADREAWLTEQLSLKS
jgi:hypothetical protein